MEDFRNVADKIFEDIAGKAPARVCIPCCNCDPGIDGGCFLRLQPQLDLGIKETGFSTIFQPVKNLQSVSSSVIRELVCEGYNDESMGYPKGHIKQGGWVCYGCGFYLTQKDSVDSRQESLPEHFRICPQCKVYNNFYAV